MPCQAPSASDRCWLSVFSPLASHLLTAQAWNSPAAVELVRRGVERRSAAQADPGLRSYRARAHGFVFFLAQVGKGSASRRGSSRPTN